MFSSLNTYNILRVHDEPPAADLDVYSKFQRLKEQYFDRSSGNWINRAANYAPLDAIDVSQYFGCIAELKLTGQLPYYAERCRCREETDDSLDFSDLAMFGHEIFYSPPTPYSLLLEAYIDPVVGTKHYEQYNSHNRNGLLTIEEDRNDIILSLTLAQLSPENVFAICRRICQENSLFNGEFQGRIDNLMEETEDNLLIALLVAKFNHEEALSIVNRLKNTEHWDAAKEQWIYKGVAGRKEYCSGFKLIELLIEHELGMRENSPVPDRATLPNVRSF